MTAEAFIHLRVTQETKSQLRALAQRENQSESALLKQLLGVMLRGVGGEVPALRERDRSANRQARLTIRLQASDHLLLCERAEARAIPAATYVSVLVRSHLRSLAPLPKAELLALHEKTRQAHLKGDAVPIAQSIGDHLLMADNGTLRTQSNAEVAAFFTGYLKRVRYSEWRDASPPVVAISPMGKWPGWRSQWWRNIQAPTSRRRAKKASRAAGSPHMPATIACGE